MIVSTTHETLVIEPWEQLPGGVRVAHADDAEQPIILLRDRAEVAQLVNALWSALVESEPGEASLDEVLVGIAGNAIGWALHADDGRQVVERDDGVLSIDVSDEEKERVVVAARRVVNQVGIYLARQQSAHLDA